MARTYFSYSVVRSDPSNLTTGGDAILTSLKDVTWTVKKIDESGNEQSTAIYSGSNEGASSIPGAGGTTDWNGLIEFWANPGQYAVNIVDPKARVATKKLYWDSVSGQTGGIPGDNITSESITTTQIGDTQVKAADIDSGAVTTAKLAAGAVTNAKLSDDTIERAKLSVELRNALVPLGTVLDWFPPASATNPGWSVPSGFAICDGTEWSSIANDMGYSSGNIPNLIGKVTFGAQPSLNRGTASGHTSADGTQTNPGVAGTVGANATTHSHTVPSHYHSIDHNHGSHSHTINDHYHSLGGHSHSWSGKIVGVMLGSSSQGSANVIATSSMSSNSDNGGGTYGPSDRGTNGQTISHSGNSGTKEAVTTDGNSYLDNRPSGIGVLKIMKVKNI